MILLRSLVAKHLLIEKHIIYRHLYNRSVSLKNCRHFSSAIDSYITMTRKMTSSVSNSHVVEWTQTNLIAFHDWSSLPWCAIIAIITLTVRALITFPLGIHQQKTLNKYEALKPEIDDFAKKLRSEIQTYSYAHNLSEIKAKLLFNFQLKRYVKQLIIRDNCSPVKASLVIWFQIPFWVIISYSIRNMSYMLPLADDSARIVYNQLANEGLFWFTNLTVTDPFFILPFLTAFVNLTNIEYHSRQRLQSHKKTRFHKVVTNLGRGFSIVMIPIGCYMPSGIVFYWFVSSSSALLQNIILKNEKVKKALGLLPVLDDKNIKKNVK